MSRCGSYHASSILIETRREGLSGWVATGLPMSSPVCCRHVTLVGSTYLYLFQFWRFTYFTHACINRSTFWGRTLGSCTWGTPTSYSGQRFLCTWTDNSRHPIWYSGATLCILPGSRSVKLCWWIAFFSRTLTFGTQTSPRHFWRLVKPRTSAPDIPLLRISHLWGASQLNRRPKATELILPSKN